MTFGCISLVRHICFTWVLEDGHLPRCLSTILSDENRIDEIRKDLSDEIILQLLALSHAFFLKLFFWFKSTPDGPELINYLSYNDSVTFNNLF